MRVSAAVVICLLVACGPSHRNNGDDDPGDCVDGTKRCTGNELETCQGGKYEASETCAMACDPSLGCVTCVPNTGTCNGNTSTACLPDGSGYADEYCDPVMGSTCDAGLCTGPCADRSLGKSYIGCEYYATITSQLVNPSFQFAVAISNTTTSIASVTIEGGALAAPITAMVNPNEVATRYLPWVPALKTCNTQGFLECGAPQQYGALAANGGYRIRSTQPVTVYQFSPLDYSSGGNFSYSNDASLLLPTNAWGAEYVVASWQAWNTGGAGIMPGLLAVTAGEDGTAVTITTRANTTGGAGAPSFVSGTPQMVTLNRGDVLELMTSSGDLTGSRVSSSKPVQVIGGHHCTQVPIGTPACDHMEESAFPTETLANRYLVTPPILGAAPRVQMIRIIATAPNTAVTLDPAAVGGPYTLANPGDFVELPLKNQDFEAKADQKILIAQYSVSQDVPGGNGSGDPDMALAVPVAQYRTSYQFHAPTNYTTNYVNITAPTGAEVMLDGTLVPLASYTAIGGSGHGVARVALSNAGTGTHTATSSMGFGISVYGYGSYTSYWYPGGLDLESIVLE
jgi:IgGFc binding protein